jgi:hypothetical protein
MYKNFEWPVPLGYEPVPGEAFIDPEPATLVRVGGQKLQGALTSFLVTRGELEFLPSGERVSLDISIADIVQLRLTRPVRMRARGAAAAPDKQPFRVDFVNGEVLEGMTRGSEVRSAGIFLYIGTYDDFVVRSFVPTKAIKRHQLSDTPSGRAGSLAEYLQVPNNFRAGIVSREQLHAALERQSAMPMIRLGEALVGSRRITADQLRQAVELQKRKRNQPLGEILIELGHLTRPDLYHALSQQLAIPAVDLKNFTIDPLAIEAVPKGMVREFVILPLCFDGEAIVVAMGNPLDPAPAEKIRLITRRVVRPVLAHPADLAEAIRLSYSPSLAF